MYTIFLLPIESTLYTWVFPGKETIQLSLQYQVSHTYRSLGISLLSSKLQIGYYKLVCDFQRPLSTEYAQLFLDT